MKNMIQRLFMEELISDPEGHEKIDGHESGVPGPVFHLELMDRSIMIYEVPCSYLEAC